MIKRTLGPSARWFIRFPTLLPVAKSFPLPDPFEKMFAHDNGICRAFYPARLSLPPNRTRRTSVRFFFSFVNDPLSLNAPSLSLALSYVWYMCVLMGYESYILTHKGFLSICLMKYGLFPMDPAGRFRNTKKSSVFTSWCTICVDGAVFHIRAFIAANFSISELNRIFALCDQFSFYRPSR